jgi:acetyl esterase/lipase
MNQYATINRLITAASTFCPCRESSNMNRRHVFQTLCFCWLCSAATASDVIEIPIWPGIAPGSNASALVEEYQDRPITDGTDIARDRHVSGVTKPSLTVYLPAKEKASGVGVVVCPGGGFNILALDKEGHDVARWLKSHGIAGIVVKYRLPDPKAGLFVRNGSMSDVQRAIRVVRHRADEWNIDPNRIGVTGFSAGGYLAAAAGTMFDNGNPQAEDPIQRVSCRPDFIAPIYPLVSLEMEREKRARIIERMLGTPVTDEAVRKYSPDLRVTPETPPAFLVHAHDDGLSVKHSVLFYLALQEAAVPAELHVYSQGGHGFGIRQRGQPISEWPDRWLQWMRAAGILQAHSRGWGRGRRAEI